MKLIIENIKGEYFAYREEETHHKNVEPARSKRSKKLTPDQLDNECLLDSYGENFYFVVPIKKGAKPK